MVDPQEFNVHQSITDNPSGCAKNQNQIKRMTATLLGPLPVRNVNRQVLGSPQVKRITLRGQLNLFFEASPSRVLGSLPGTAMGTINC